MEGIPTMSVDEMLWLGLMSNPGKMLVSLFVLTLSPLRSLYELDKSGLIKQSWAMIGSVFVALVTTKTISDTVRYYDHYGYTDRVIVTGIGIGTSAALYVHVSQPLVMRRRC
jgi:hypothetical protein